jgi:hypothetical protein
MKRASEAPFPYGSRRVCYILADHNEGITQVHGKAELRLAIQRVRAGEGEVDLLAAWPGQWRTDLFLIDDLRQLEEALA